MSTPAETVPSALIEAAGDPAAATGRTATSDGLSAEVRDSVLLLLLSMLVTVGLAGAVSALLSALA